ncbi:HAMP domain-containing sensor histidine kinase [Nonomuraea sp. NPDC059007]|uniref:HAMP domain-containing sensor histidine kinase n=1 Tax=Nonomuraea sp. NPDC059007 TaxID=3346692 RepID=UPI00369ACBC1
MKEHAHTPAQALFRRLFVINALVFAAGTLVLALSPATVSSPVLLAEIPVLAIGLALILAANALLVRASLAPLTALTSLMQRVDLLHNRDRLREDGNGDLASVVTTFNQMLDRLEEERASASAHALAAQEAERGRIARELHDEIGQSLTVALLGLKRTRDRAPAELTAELEHTQEAIRASLDEVRQVARRLRPGVLEDLGLHSALTALATDLSQTGSVHVTRSLASVPALAADVELVLYRIAQESLTNVARHAGATTASLTLAVEDGEVVLRVTDDGRGGVREHGAGIRGMHERALLIGARLSIHSPPGGGTRITLTVPAAAKEPTA